MLWAAANLHRSAQQQLPQVLSHEDLRTLAGLLTDPGRSYLKAPDIAIPLYSLAKLGVKLDAYDVAALLRRFLASTTTSTTQRADAAGGNVLLPQHFANVCWAIIRMGHKQILQQPGTMHALLQAFFAAGAQGGAWAGAETDPRTASTLLWAVASCIRPDDVSGSISNTRWQQLHGTTSWRQLGSETAGDAAAAAAADSEQASLSGDMPAAAAAAAAASTIVSSSDGVTQHQIQRLFDSFMQHRSLASADIISISTVMWSAALLNHPMSVDDIKWLLAAFMQPDRLAAADAESITHVMYGVTHCQLVQKQQLPRSPQQQQPSPSQQQQPSQLQPPLQQQQHDDVTGVSLHPAWASKGKSSSSSNISSVSQLSTRSRFRAQQQGSHQLSCTTTYIPATNSSSRTAAAGSSRGSSTTTATSIAAPAQPQDSLAPALAKLAHAFAALIPLQASNEDLTDALLSLAKACVTLEGGGLGSNSSSSSSSSISGRGPWVFQHQHLLQEGLWAVLQQVLLLMSSQQHSTDTADAAAAYSDAGTLSRAAASLSLRPGGSSGVAAAASKRPSSSVQQLRHQHNRLVESCSLHCAVDAVWACDILGVAHPHFLAAVAKAAACPWPGSTISASSAAAAAAAGNAAAVTSLNIPAVHMLSWSDVATLLAKLASLNHLSVQLWQCAVQPLLAADCEGVGEAAAGAASSWLQQAASNSPQSAANSSSNSGGNAASQAGMLSPSQLQMLSRAAQFVPRLCWAAAAGNLQDCRGSVVLLCQRWVNYLAQQQQPGAADASIPHSSSSSSSGSSSAAVLQGQSDITLCRLFQVHMWLQDTAEHCSDTTSSTNNGLHAALSAEQLALCAAAWKSQAREVNTTSQLQKSIAEVSRSIPGLDSVQVEAMTPDGCFSVDIVAHVNLPALAAAAGGQLMSGNSLAGAELLQLAVEADGPSHFVVAGSPTQADPLVLRGEAQLRTRGLLARGYKVLRVSHVAWQQQQQQPLELQGWLAGRVYEAVVSGSGYACCL